VALMVIAAACTSSDTTPMFDSGPVTVTVYPTNSTAQLEPTNAHELVVRLRAETGCADIGNATAAFDGVPLEVDDPGTFLDTSEGPDCKDIVLGLANPPMRAGQSQSLVVSDASHTWTIAGTNLFGANFVTSDALVSNRQVAITWTDAQSVTSAPDSFVELHDAAGALKWTTFLSGSHAPPVVDDPSALTIAGNVLDIALPILASGDVLSLGAERVVAVDTCDGPASCSITSNAGSDFITP
jgi:hypothetical protein